MYYSQNEFVEILEKAKDLAVRYSDSYTRLLHDMDNASQNSYRTRRTIHNLKESIRPDLTSVNINMRFFDNSSTWRNKKARTYNIVRSSDGRIQCISVKNEYTEFFVYDGDDVILADYSFDKSTGSFTPESVGCGHYENGRIAYFFVNELKGGYPEEKDLHFKLCKYSYNDDRLSTIVLYNLMTAAKINIDFSDIGNYKVKYPNPEIYLDKLIYDEQGRLYLIERHCPQSNIAGVAKIEVDPGKVSF